MLKTNSCTVSAPQSFSSILSTQVSLSCTQNDITDVIIPYSDLLPIGQYSSKILSVSEGVCCNKPYIDCVHELVDENGKIYIARLRYFAPKETNALRDKLVEYRMVGTMAEVLNGLEEIVTIAPKSGSEKYVFISQRALATSTILSPSSAKKHSSLGKRSYFGNKAHSTSKSPTREVLLEDDEDEEFDDFLEEDDE